MYRRSYYYFHAVTFIFKFLRILKYHTIHIKFKKKIYVNIEYVRRPFSNRCVSTKRDAQYIRQYQHLIRVFDKQFFASYKYNTFTFNVYLFISIILIFQKSCVILSQNAIGKLSGRKF